MFEHEHDMCTVYEYVKCHFMFEGWPSEAINALRNLVLCCLIIPYYAIIMSIYGLHLVVKFVR